MKVDTVAALDEVLEIGVLLSLGVAESKRVIDARFLEVSAAHEQVLNQHIPLLFTLCDGNHLEVHSRIVGLDEAIYGLGGLPEVGVRSS